MIKRHIRPQRGIVTSGTIGRRKWRSSSRVCGIIGLLPCREVALRISAIHRLNLQVVVVVDVAGGAGWYLARRHQLVRIRQRKACSAVIEIRSQPRNRIVASRAGCNRKHRGRRRMLRVGRLLPRGKMATCIPAVRRRDLQIVVVAYMTVHAGNIRVPVRERKIDRGGGVV